MWRRVAPDAKKHQATRGADFDDFTARHVERMPVDQSWRSKDERK